MKLDEVQLKNLREWKSELETEEARINEKVNKLTEETRLLRTRKGLLDVVHMRYGDDAKRGDVFKQQNIEGLQNEIKSKESELEKYESEARIKLTHIHFIIQEIDSWLRRAQ